MASLNSLWIKEAFESELRLYLINKDQLFLPNKFIHLLRFVAYLIAQPIVAFIAFVFLVRRIITFGSLRPDLESKDWLFVNVENASRANHALSVVKQKYRFWAITPMGRYIDKSVLLSLGKSPIGFPFQMTFRLLLPLFWLVPALVFVYSRSLASFRVGYSMGFWYRLFFGAYVGLYVLNSAEGKLPSRVIFAHAGLADSWLVTEALNARGVISAHWLHGIDREGIMRSNTHVDLCLCGYDAQSRVLQEIGKNGCYLPLTKPHFIACPSIKKVHVSSNLFHPTNPSAYRFIGSQEEKFLDLIVALTHGVQVIWRPHPAIGRLDTSEVGLFYRRCADAGVIIDESPSLVAERETLYICSLSTVAIDLLALGVVPLVYDPDRLAVHSVYECFPVVESDPDLFQRQIGLLLSNRLCFGESAFDRTWQSAQPGRRINSPAWLGEIMSQVPVSDLRDA